MYTELLSSFQAKLCTSMEEEKCQCMEGVVQQYGIGGFKIWILEGVYINVVKKQGSRLQKIRSKKWGFEGPHKHGQKVEVSKVYVRCGQSW